MNWALLAAAGVLGGLTGSIAGLASVRHLPRAAAGRASAGDRQRHQHCGVGVQTESIGLGSRPSSRAKARGSRGSRPPPRSAARSARHCCCRPRPQGFERVVPILLGLASVAILLPRTSRQEQESLTTNDIPSRSCLEAASIFAICIYGGYFGAAGRCATARDAVADRQRDARARQRRQERDPWRRKQRCGNDLCGRRTRELACRHRCRCWMPDRIATRPRGGPPCARRTDPCGDRCGRTGAGGQARRRRVRLGQAEGAVALDHSGCQGRSGSGRLHAALAARRRLACPSGSATTCLRITTPSLKARHRENSSPALMFASLPAVGFQQ